MLEFINALCNYPFMQNALLAGVLASIACGVTGTYVVVKRLSFIGGGIAHAVLGGMGVAYYFGVNPVIGAVISAILSALIIGGVRLRLKQHEDTVIGALWAVGMAVGVIFISLARGYNVDLMSFLFGNILMVSRTNLLIIAILDFTVIILVIVFFHPFLALCFDEEHASQRGVPVDFLYLLLLCIVALTVVVLIQIVGLVLVIALLTLPAAIAGLFTSSLRKMMILASVLGWIFTTLGLMFSYDFNLPSGATIIVIAGVSYLASFLLKRFYVVAIRKKISQSQVEK